MSLEVYCDGSCLDNQNAQNRRAGSGYVVREDGERVYESSDYVGDGEDVSNNVAEYEAVIAALEWRRDNRPGEPVDVYTDSTLIVNQVLGEWKCNENHLFTRRTKIVGLMNDDDTIQIKDEGKPIVRAHDLAKSGAHKEEPPNKSTGTTRRRSSGGETETTEIDVEPLQSIPGGVEAPHAGFNPDGIPDTLKYHVQWINWKPEEIDGRETKVPRRPHDTRKKAKSTDEATWSDFKTAVEAVNHETPGIGFVLTTGDPFVAIDIDDCRNPETMEIEDWALDIVDRFDSFTQISVSNTGLHVFVKANGVPNDWKNKKEHEKELEIYDWGRFLAMTGHRLEGTPISVTEQPHFDVAVNRIERKHYD